jgi:hypothetical protein
LDRCAECCADADCDTGDLCTTSSCDNGSCIVADVCGPDEHCDPDTGECVCAGIPCNDGSCCPGGTFCCTFGENCINGCCVGEVGPSGFCCIGQVNSEGVCCEGNIACGAGCCDADTQECNEELDVCVTVRACPIGYEEVADACFKIVPNLDACNCPSGCTHCVGSIIGSSNYLCVRDTDYGCTESGVCIPGYSACKEDSRSCWEAC